MCGEVLLGKGVNDSARGLEGETRGVVILAEVTEEEVAETGVPEAADGGGAFVVG